MSARPLRIAIIGDRGIPARYSGFSTLVEQLALRLVHEHGMEVTVYCRNHYYEEHPKTWQGVRCVWLPAPGGKSLESIVHSNLAFLHAATQGYDLAFVVDPGNAPFVMPLVLARVPTVFHTDGLGWQRRKWTPFQQRFYKWTEKVCARLATGLVTDARAMQAYYREQYDAGSVFIPYSGDVGDAPSDECLSRFGVEKDQYYLVVARMEPENNVDLIIREYRASGLSKPLIVVGGSPYPTDYSDRVVAESHGVVRCVGGIFESAILNGLYRNCAAYLHGHEVGGTNPSLLRAMHWGAACIPIDVVFHREVLGTDNPFFGTAPGALAALLLAIDTADDERRRLGHAARDRARRLYRWGAVADAYAGLFRDIVVARGKRAMRAILARDYYHPEREEVEAAA
jgi:glycosyltransferase involved in cell wall biosynthesis